MIHIVEWKNCYYTSQSTAYFNMYTQTPCSVLLLVDCCNEELVTDVKSMLQKCTPEFQTIRVLNVHKPTFVSKLQSILRSNLNLNWVLVVNSFTNVDPFIEEEQKWHQLAREKIEPNQSTQIT